LLILSPLPGLEAKILAAWSRGRSTVFYAHQARGGSIYAAAMQKEPYGRLLISARRARRRPRQTARRPAAQGAASSGPTNVGGFSRAKTFERDYPGRDGRSSLCADAAAGDLCRDRERVAPLCEEVPEFSPASLLDAGCGLASASFAALEIWPDIANVELFDRSPQFLALAGRLTQASPHAALERARVVAADLRRRRAAGPPISLSRAMR